MNLAEFISFNVPRFVEKCLTDRPAALTSLKIVARRCYSRVYWTLRPRTAIRYRFPFGGLLLLEPKHVFTALFWPNIERYEPDVCGLLQQVLKPGGTFIDCGANVGFFSIQAGALVGKTGTVISIEANPHTYEFLGRNLQANGFGLPIHCALTLQTGEVELFVPGSWDVYSSLRADGLVEGTADHSYKVKARTLDDVVAELALAKIDLVKIDIEGGELDVLRSAPNVLSVMRPMFVIEYGVNTWASFDARYEDLLHLLERHSYSARIFDPVKKELLPVPEDVRRRTFVNLVLVPAEHGSGEHESENN
jgi:FkbM family methyltransferase